MPSPHGARAVGDAEREGDGGGSARGDRKEPLSPHGDARPRPGTGPGLGGSARGRRPGDSGDCGRTPVKWTRSVSPGWRGGRVCGVSWLPSLRVLGNSSCTSEATAPGAGSLNLLLKLAFGRVLQDSGPDVSAIQFQGSGDCAPQLRCVAGTGTVRGCGLRSQGSSGAPEVGCA